MRRTLTSGPITGGILLGLCMGSGAGHLDAVRQW